MMLSDGAQSITLPDALHWPDEFWTPVVQAVEYGLTGALLRQSSAKLAGRPITLQSVMQGDLVYGDVSRETLAQLQAMASDPTAELTLTFADGVSFQCVFRHHEEAISAQPAFGHSQRRSGEWWLVTLRLMEI